MNKDELIQIIKRKWDSQGGCRSCGWHACIYEYGDILEAADIDEESGVVWLPCKSGESGHRGVYICMD